MFIKNVQFQKHPILGDLNIDFINHSTGFAYPVVVFVGENGCGKTTLLSQIANYHDSPYIVNKMSFELSITSYARPVALFIRQDSKYCGAMNELTKVISGGKEPFPTHINALVEGDTGYINHQLRIKDVKYLELDEFIDLFGNKKIAATAKSNELFDIKCGGEVLRMTSGEKSPVDLTTLSSGEQELLLKIRDIRKVYQGTDFVLIDEPETSLHPRWQKTILKSIIELLQPEHGNNSSEPQIFVSTHSEKVLESIVDNENVLIVRLAKDGDKIEAERIEQMKLVLPRPTFAELDYVVYHIPTLDYHDQLFSYFGSFFDKDTITAIDRKIEKNAIKKYGKANIDKYKKERISSRFNKVYLTKMLPTYIRDYFHHPNDIKKPIEEELILSIEFLRDLIKFVKENKTIDIEESQN